ncbi:MAG TPA: ester cyclase [Saprospiraceae bacterium]|nr:ester cyclase [Saprospiraceae bacterium]
MKKTIIKINLVAALLVMAATATFTSCTNNNSDSAVSKSEIDSLRNQIAQLTAGNEMIAKNLATFDTLDYTVFSNQEWTRLHESHAKDIKVNWPDGHFTTGIEKHIEDLKAMFVYAPNTSIKQHPIRFGSDNMTCVTGIMTGTFSAPMPIGNGKFIPPTNKSFSLPMCTVGIWKDGVMIEEYLFWDNQTYMNQIGLGK